MSDSTSYTFSTAAVQLAAAGWLIGAAAVNTAGATVKGAINVAGAVTTLATTLVKGAPAPPPISEDWVDLAPSKSLVDQVRESGDLESGDSSTDNTPVTSAHP
jgi:hypothetical protein